MALKATALTCPQCGANLDAPEGRDVMYCTYCGARIMLSDDSEYTYHIGKENKKNPTTLTLSILGSSVAALIFIYSPGWLIAIFPIVMGVIAVIHPTAIADTLILFIGITYLCNGIADLVALGALK